MRLRALSDEQGWFDRSSSTTPGVSSAIEPSLRAGGDSRSLTRGRHDARVARALTAHHRDVLVDLAHIPASVNRSTACWAAMSVGARLILGGELPMDVRQHRWGVADLLIRDRDAKDHPVYHPAVIRDHAVLAPIHSGQGGQLVASTSSPFLDQAVIRGQRFRIETHSNDLIELAHLWYLVGAAGFGADQAWGAIIGADPSSKPGGYAVTWVNLSERQIRTFAYQGERQWKKHSALSRYRHESRFRVRIAEHALGRTGADADSAPVCEPVRIPQCQSCPWWSTCRVVLADDISTAIERAPLDPREIMTLRSLGVTTTGDLASADVESLLPQYLPLVAHRGGAEDRLRLAAHRGRLIADGVSLERITSGTIELPSAPIEIDLDMETSAHNQVYLWGFLIHDRREPGLEPTYCSVSSFSALTAPKEAELALEAANRLKRYVDSVEGVPVLVWHYSSYETTTLRRLAHRGHDATQDALDWLLGFSRERFVDLFAVVKKHFFGVQGLGLKAVAAQGAGFAWRDPAPGGLNSQFWFSDAVNAPTAQLRQAAADRVLRYNEDDVRATWAVRQWLRTLS
jgi:predicted RecB family nuclease